MALASISSSSGDIFSHICQGGFLSFLLDTDGFYLKWEKGPRFWHTVNHNLYACTSEEGSFRSPTLLLSHEYPTDACRSLLFYQACRDSNVLAPTKPFIIGLKSSCFLLMQVLLAISSSCALTNVKELSLLRETFHTLKFSSLGCFATSALWWTKKNYDFVGFLIFMLRDSDALFWLWNLLNVTRTPELIV